MGITWIAFAFGKRFAIACSAILLTSTLADSASATPAREAHMLRVIEAQGCSVPLSQTRSVFVQNGFTDPVERLALMSQLRADGEVGIFSGNLEARTRGCGRSPGATVFHEARLNAFIQLLVSGSCTIRGNEMRRAVSSIGITDQSELGLFVSLIVAAGVGEVDLDNDDIRLTDWPC